MVPEIVCFAGKVCLSFAVSLSLLSMVPAQASWQNCQRAEFDRANATVDLSVLQDQVNQSFEQKFAKVSTDWRRTNDDNFVRIKRLLEEKRPGFDVYQVEAEKHLPGILNRLSIEHETKLVGLKANLKRGSILSTDETIRRGVVDLKEKKGRSSNPVVDGIIGEQDTVFAAIRETYTSDYAQTFGDFTFTFNTDRILEKGYFTPFAFGVGIGTGKWDISCGIPIYSQWVFHGKEGFRQFLTLSIAQILWEKNLEEQVKNLTQVRTFLQNVSQELNRIYEVWKERHKAILAPGTYSIQDVDANDAWKETSIRSEVLKLEPVFQKFHQISAFESSFFQDKAERLVSSRLSGESNPQEINALLAAYQGFPSEPSQFPPSLLLNSRFWELKIPREVSLEFVKSIAIPTECDADQNLPQWCEGAKQAILDYSDRSGRKFQTRRAPHPVHQEITVYEFLDKGRGH
jgi:hypothetical protein